ncbi:MAG: zinc-ribbon domain-containing protein [Bacillota bacterium]
MKYCVSCGQEIADDAAFCTNCGAPQSTQEPVQEAAKAQPQPQQQAQPQQPQQPQFQQQAPYQQPAQNNVNDKGGFGWGLLGCCIPIVGLILFLVWKGDKPQTAKAAGIGALVGVGVSIIFYIISFVAGLAGTAMY